MNKEYNEIVQLQNLTTGYGPSHIVGQSLTATMKKGELICLLGANGCGKTTLLRTLSGFQPIIDGDILIQGKTLTDYSEKELAKQIAVVLTEKCEVNNLTVSQLVALGRSPHTGFWGSLNQQDQTIVFDALDQTRISAFTNRIVQTLSDGERQKVMIAKALAQQTPLIFLDEPTAFLDFDSKVEIMRLLSTLAHQNHITVFLSTHDLEMALQIADKLWLMTKTSQLKTGTPEDLSLNGSLEQFMQNESILFNSSTGLYSIQIPPTKQIKVEGQGNLYAMICKAFARRGVHAFAGAKSNYTIKVSQNHAIISQNRRELFRTKTIEDILQIIDKL